MPVIIGSPRGAQIDMTLTWPGQPRTGPSRLLHGSFLVPDLQRATAPPAAPSAKEAGSSRPTLATARFYVLLAAVLWSLSALFTRILTHETPLRLGPKAADGTSIAFFRVVFASLAILPLVRPSGISFRWLMAPMVACFAIMNVLFVLAMTWGKSSNVILLQYTAPMWMVLGSICFLGETASRRGSIALLIGMIGIGIVAWGGWNGAERRS